MAKGSRTYPVERTMWWSQASKGTGSDTHLISVPDNLSVLNEKHYQALLSYRVRLRGDLQGDMPATDAGVTAWVIADTARFRRALARAYAAYRAHLSMLGVKRSKHSDFRVDWDDGTVGTRDLTPYGFQGESMTPIDLLSPGTIHGDAAPANPPDFDLVKMVAQNGTARALKVFGATTASHAGILYEYDRSGQYQVETPRDAEQDDIPYDFLLPDEGVASEDQKEFEYDQGDVPPWHSEVGLPLMKKVAFLDFEADAINGQRLITPWFDAPLGLIVLQTRTHPIGQGGTGGLGLICLEAAPATAQVDNKGVYATPLLKGVLR